jgi:hypothetical protein
VQSDSPCTPTPQGWLAAEHGRASFGGTPADEHASQNVVGLPVTGDTA